ncbi:hypothetical protein ACFL2Z_00110 [Candidatus Eisenbacteria bacterium]|uniref:Toxin-antitoxin system HicB family antitoxin n=1 Tax=Eiseniibacteriota bacterium TaxID=2212470 RepID=A0ABV6YMM7_UNCEI
MRKKIDKAGTRVIHVRLTDEIHRLLRIRVAEEDTHIQDWVARLIERELKGKKKGGGRHGKVADR